MDGRATGMRTDSLAMMTLQQWLLHLVLAVALLAAAAFALLMSIEILFRLRRWARLLIGGIGSRRTVDRAAGPRASQPALDAARRAMRNLRRR